MELIMDICRDDLRNRLIEHIRKMLANVSEDMEFYIPESAVLDNSKITIEITSDSIPTITCELIHPIRNDSGYHRVDE